jgi:hypothetical protein
VDIDSVHPLEETPYSDGGRVRLCHAFGTIAVNPLRVG